MRRSKQLKGVEATFLIGHDTYFIQVPTSPETSLCRTETQDVTYVRLAHRGRPLQLPLFLHKGLVLSPARLNLAPPGPTLLQKPNQQLDGNRRRGSPKSLSSPLVSLVSPNRGTTRDGLCSTCSSRFKTSSNPVNRNSALRISRMERKMLSVRKKIC